ncbi:formyltransferase family protein [Amylibacter sp. IMCC11727]|uniref:formyltransferase family protein n=1 Tax=Amylibacter sp. IMCC11727 TaxID=3039851 RepID=UPI00244E0B11|nr:formyltransferase family protein [Amylibacter sp. IMCC11727]WGI23278.1 formyltransferase family protein [Amylibacter sp. IMCC11727]
MKVTVFTSNQTRHLHFIKRLQEVTNDLHVVMETLSVFPGKVQDFYNKSEPMQRYFSRVLEAEEKVFATKDHSLSNINLIPLRSGDLNHMSKEQFGTALDADLYIVFGGSWIRGWLIDFLMSKRTVNIHMGMSPWYRGAACNFWACKDGNPQYVGATLHLLAKGLDTGGMLYHVRPEPKLYSDSFEFTMASVRSAHEVIFEKIQDGSLLSVPPVEQDKSKEIRYTRNSEFTDEIALDWLENEPKPEEIRDALLDADAEEFVRLHLR